MKIISCNRYENDDKRPVGIVTTIYNREDEIIRNAFKNLISKNKLEDSKVWLLMSDDKGYTTCLNSMDIIGHLVSVTIMGKDIQCEFEIFDNHKGNMFFNLVETYVNKDQLPEIYYNVVYDGNNIQEICYFIC